MSDKVTLSFTPVDKIPGNYRITKLQKLLQEFVDSNVPCAVVNGTESYKGGFTGNLNRAAKRFGFQVIAVGRGGTTYLIRLEPDAK